MNVTAQAGTGEALSPFSVKDELSKYIITSKYARYNEEKKRRETWEEAVDRVLEMHLDKYSHLEKTYLEQISEAFQYVKDQKIVPSMRSLQFGGKAIKAQNARGFNCSVRHMDSVRAIAETFYLLLCGCGVGIGLSKRFISKFPKLYQGEFKEEFTWVVEDTIEGWADSAEVLIKSFLEGNEYTGKRIIFDYSKIRPKGAKLETSGGKAPGYKGLAKAHYHIESLLLKVIKETDALRPIHIYDIVMHCADAVLSGGVRRSAVSAVFDKDDVEMINAKVGNWSEVNPQRARSNNSVLILRDNTSLEEFQEIIKRTREWGEPAFVFANHEDTLYNPCQPESALLLTRKGLTRMRDINEGDEIWSETGWTKVVKKWSTGIKDVYKYKTSAGYFLGTENHKIVQNGEKVEVMLADSIDVLRGDLEFLSKTEVNLQDVVDGIVIGDGSVHQTSKDKVFAMFGEKDVADYLVELKDYVIDESKQAYCAYKIKTTITPDELDVTYKRTVPERILTNVSKYKGFLRGLYSANGSVVHNRITLKSTSLELVEQVQLMLSALGIRSYYTTNRSKLVEFSNGVYECKESYDLNITVDRLKFYNEIGFIQNYKMEKLKVHILSEGKAKKSFEIKEVEYIGKEEVFDITVDNEPHTYWTGGLNVSNCFEVSFIPVTEGGKTGVQFCNLSSVNGSKVKTEEDFYDFVEKAAIIGTLQAGYTDFPYLSPEAKELTEKEALLGVSIIAMMENPKILLNPEIQKKGAKIAIEANRKWAKLIGINQASRVTTVKPDGTCSLALGTMFSGIHPAHSPKMIRRVQANKEDNVYKYFKEHNPHLCEESVWSANKTDDVISFPIETEADALFKDDLTAIEHLEIIKSTQENWVNGGTSEVNEKPVSHNVSCTVTVKDNEWDDVVNYLYDNRNYFSAVSFLSDTGDKKYAQAPREAIVTSEEEEYFNNLLKSFKPVDYTRMIEEDDFTEVKGEIACAGGACEL